MQVLICIYIHANNTVVADNMHDIRFEIWRCFMQVPKQDMNRSFGDADTQMIGASRVAQWIERSFPKRQVVGSNPISGDMVWSCNFVY